MSQDTSSQDVGGGSQLFQHEHVPFPEEQVPSLLTITPIPFMSYPIGMYCEMQRVGQKACHEGGGEGVHESRQREFER